MEFIELKKESGCVYEGLRVREKYVTISLSLKSRMGMPEYVTIFFDKENRAVALKPSTALTGRKLITSSKTHLAAKLPPEMPRGRYSFTEEREGMFICVALPTTN